jgi:hypothetical protein
LPDAHHSKDANLLRDTEQTLGLKEPATSPKLAEWSSSIPPDALGENCEALPVESPWRAISNNIK